MTVLTGALLLMPSRAWAQNGSLKVTSFPSGANVSVDGEDTGKVTPMSISVSVGTHTVVVSIPNSSWNADTRNVDVASGNNDLSVTLLPISTIGPIGPPGPKGDKGDPGAAGAAATIQVGTTMTVPAGRPASVLNGGTANAAVLNFLIPQGPQGPAGADGAAGAAATIQVGTTMTVAAGTPASVLNGGTANAAVLNFLIPQGPQGLKGDTGATGPTGGLNGRQEFQSSGTFAVPPGVTRLSVELYGAGGGGAILQCNNGGGGGSGAYTSTIFILPVQENQILTINVGIGGLAAASSGASGGNGGDTQVLDANGKELAVAHGGTGGQPDSLPCGAPAAGAVGGASDTNAMISHSGASAPSFSPLNSGGVGYLVTGFAFQANGQFGGGGAGATSFPPAHAGQGGYALLSW